MHGPNVIRQLPYAAAPDLRVHHHQVPPDYRLPNGLSGGDPTAQQLLSNTELSGHMRDPVDRCQQPDAQPARDPPECTFGDFLTRKHPSRRTSSPTIRCSPSAARRPGPRESGRTSAPGQSWDHVRASRCITYFRSYDRSPSTRQISELFRPDSCTPQLALGISWIRSRNPPHSDAGEPNRQFAAGDFQRVADCAAPLIQRLHDLFGPRTDHLGVQLTHRQTSAIDSVQHAEDNEVLSSDADPQKLFHDVATKTYPIQTVQIIPKGGNDIRRLVLISAQVVYWLSV